MKIKFISKKDFYEKDPICVNCRGVIRVGFLTELENIRELEQAKELWERFYWSASLRRSKRYFCYSCAMNYFVPAIYKIIRERIGKRIYRFNLPEDFIERGFYINETIDKKEAWGHEWDY